MSPASAALYFGGVVERDIKPDNVDEPKPETNGHRPGTVPKTTPQRRGK